MEQSKIYVSRSHGDYDGLGSKIYISSDTSTEATISHSDIYDFQNNVPLVDLSNCELMLFVACKTAGPTNDINNNYYSICNAAVLAGAEYAVGFTETINCHDANWWTEFFFSFYVAENEDVSSTGKVIDICDAAISAGSPENTSASFLYKSLSSIQTRKVFPLNNDLEEIQ